MDANNKGGTEYSENIEEPSNDGIGDYTPLKRQPLMDAKPMNKLPIEMDHGDNTGSPHSDIDSSSEDFSDNDLKTTNNTSHKKTVHRNLKLSLVNKKVNVDRNGSRNVWSKVLEEEMLAETMRGCDVTKSCHDRDVETYDPNHFYRISDKRAPKRGLPGDFTEDNTSRGDSKRSRYSDENPDDFTRGKFYEKDLLNSTPFHVEDIDENIIHDSKAFAHDIANKLNEKHKVGLIRLIIDTLGINTTLQIYKETQLIESKGGMAIMDGSRRRTCGGVFFYIIKMNPSISFEDKETIFKEDFLNRKQKRFNAIRVRKIQQLKKMLIERRNKFEAFGSRQSSILTAVQENQHKTQNKVLNPPPSPENCEDNLDHEYVPMNNVPSHIDQPDMSDNVSDTSEDKDILEIHYTDNDFF